MAKSDLDGVFEVGVLSNPALATVKELPSRRLSGVVKPSNTCRRPDDTGVRASRAAERDDPGSAALMVAPPRLGVATGMVPVRLDGVRVSAGDAVSRSKRPRTRPSR